MTRNDKHELLGRIARHGLWPSALLAVALGCAPAGRAQSGGVTAPTQDAKLAAQAKAAAVIATAPAASPKEAAAPKEKPKVAGGPHEGIVVHGHWTIDVKNPDGSPASHVDFENTLNGNEGADLLTGILSGEYVPLGFTITLYNFNPQNNTSTGLCGNLGACVLTDTRDPIAVCPVGASPDSPCGGPLTYTPNKGGVNNNGAGYTLSGTVSNISNGGTIYYVFSGIHACVLPQAVLAEGTLVGILGTIGNATSSTGLDSTITGSTQSCSILSSGGAITPSPDTLGYFNLTGTNVSLPAVIAGQSITATVVITFSGS